GKVLPFLPHGDYTLLEGLGMLAVLWWYWRIGHERPEAAMVLAVMPLFLAWRSLPTYFSFFVLPIAIWLDLAPRLGDPESRREVLQTESPRSVCEKRFTLLAQEEVL